MRKTNWMLLGLLLLPATLFAADDKNPIHGEAYFFVGPIVATPYTGAGGLHINTGAGGDVLSYKGLGIGAEAGYARRGNSYQATGTASLDFSYHYLGRKPKNRFEPFVVGGPSVYFGNGGQVTGYNLGGGVNCWMQKHLAIRLELRDYGHTQGDLVGGVGFPQVNSFVGFHFGVTLR